MIVVSWMARRRRSHAACTDTATWQVSTRARVPKYWPGGAANAARARRDLCHRALMSAAHPITGLAREYVSSGLPLAAKISAYCSVGGAAVTTPNTTARGTSPFAFGSAACR